MCERMNDVLITYKMFVCEGNEENICLQRVKCVWMDEAINTHEVIKCERS